MELAAKIRGPKVRENTLFDIAQEPQVRHVPYASKDIDKLASTNERHPEECSASGDLGVVQIPSIALGLARDW
jgi:hypothetical protein